MSNTTRQYGSIFDKLTDSSIYTGAHKHRFDAAGNGRGLNGRDRIAKGHYHISGNGTADLSQFCRNNLHSSGAGYAHTALRTSINTPSGYQAPPSPTLYQRTSYDGRGSNSSVPSVQRASPSPAPAASPRPSSTGRVWRASEGGLAPPLPSFGGSTQRPSESGQRKQSIFDRLTDSSQYTGAHKHRFDAHGGGMGKSGRTTSNAYVAASDNVRRNC